MPFEREDIIKINGITLYARNDDWGQSGKQSGNKVLLTDETSSQQTDCQLDAVDFHIEAYYLGEDYQSVVSKLYKIYKQQKNMLLEHHDIGRVWVKFANGGYRIKKTNTKLWYREFVLNLVLAKTSDLKIQVVELEQLAETQLEKGVEQSLLDALDKFNTDFVTENLNSLVKNDIVNNLYALGDKISSLSADNLLGSLTNPFTGTFESLLAAAGGIAGTIQSYLNLGKSKNDRKYEYNNSGFSGEEAKKYFQSYIDIASRVDSAVDIANTEPETQQNIQTAIDLIKQTAIVKACDCVTEKPFETKESITNAIKELEKVSDSIILAAEDNKEIQNDIHNVVNQAVVILQSQPVFNSRQIQTNICLPAAVICRDENCDEETFLRVNEIRHPLFVPAGVALEITGETADE